MKKRYKISIIFFICFVLLVIFYVPIWNLSGYGAPFCHCDDTCKRLGYEGCTDACAVRCGWSFDDFVKQFTYLR